MVAEDLAERLVQEVRRRMVLPYRASSRMIDRQCKGCAQCERSLLEGAGMHIDIAGLLLGVGNAEAHAVGHHHADVADLATGLAVKRRLVENDRTALAPL